MVERDKREDQPLLSSSTIIIRNNLSYQASKLNLTFHTLLSYFSSGRNKHRSQNPLTNLNNSASNRHSACSQLLVAGCGITEGCFPLGGESHGHPVLSASVPPSLPQSTISISFHILGLQTKLTSETLADYHQVNYFQIFWQWEKYFRI